MSTELVTKLQSSIEKLKNKENRLYFLVQDTKGNAKASVRFTYEIAYELKQKGFNSIIMHEQNDYKGVSSWLSEQYMTLPHKSIEDQNLELSPEDFLIIPELYGHVMEQVAKFPCGKIVLCQSYDYVLETLAPGATWAQYGFLKCVTTSEEQTEFLKKIMKNVSFDIIEPTIGESFEEKKLPPKPIVSVHTRDTRDTMKIIKSFYLKYPQYRWITFRDMRGMSEKDFANSLKDSFVSVWLDSISGFGTFPLESMKVGVPVIGLIPYLKPEWMTDDNGVWYTDRNALVDLIADFTQNWLEDNIHPKVYETGFLTAEKYSDLSSFENTVNELFQGYLKERLESFESQLNKLETIEN